MKAKGRKFGRNRLNVFGWTCGSEAALKAESLLVCFLQKRDNIESGDGMTAGKGRLKNTETLVCFLEGSSLFLRLNYTHLLSILRF